MSTKSKQYYTPPPPTVQRVQGSPAVQKIYTAEQQYLDDFDYGGASDKLTEQLRLRELQGLERKMDEDDLKSKFQADQQAISSYFESGPPKPRSGPTGLNSGWNVGGGKKFYGYEPTQVNPNLVANQAEYLKKLSALRNTQKPLESYAAKEQQPQKPNKVNYGDGGGGYYGDGGSGDTGGSFDTGSSVMNYTPYPNNNSSGKAIPNTKSKKPVAPVKENKFNLSATNLKKPVVTITGNTNYYSNMPNPNANRDKPVATVNYLK